MNRSVTFCLFTAAILTAATGWAENQPAAPAASLVPPAAAPAAAQPPVIAEPAKPVVATLPRKLEVMPPPFGQFASLVRYADANGDMIIDDQEADAAIKVLGDAMRDQFKRRNQATINRYDLDKDGRLSAEEILKMKEFFRDSMAKARQPVTRPQINTMVPADGKLTINEKKNPRPGPFKTAAGPEPKSETKPAVAAPAATPAAAK